MVRTPEPVDKDESNLPDEAKRGQRVHGPDEPNGAAALEQT